MEYGLCPSANWAERSEYWLEKSQELPPQRGQPKRRDRKPLIVCGHGAGLQIDRGTLFVRNGFTHYPQAREEFRFFRGDPHLPNRIIIFDASGSISFDVLEWLGQRSIPLIQIDWQGNVICVANTDYSANSKLVQKQLEQLNNGNPELEFRKLLIAKFENSILTLELFAHSPEKSNAIEYLGRAVSKLGSSISLSNSDLLGMEGDAAARYFRVWQGIPIFWKLAKRDLIPKDWHFIGVRRSAIAKSNRNARHPVNAMLNYAYAVLHSYVKLNIVTEGLDPTIGISHQKAKYRDALVLDRMEPLRPVVEMEIIKLIFNETFSTNDFVVTSEGFCRVNAQLARRIVHAAASLSLSS
jgi:CRISP-associated protein Cas1